MSNPKIDTTSQFVRNLPKDFTLGNDAAQYRLFREYGAVFVARGGVIAPDKVVFEDENDVRDFQSRLDIVESRIGEFDLELQSAAMEALRNAIDTASRSGLSIMPRGQDSARRNYEDTIELWKSRVDPALGHWVANGRMSAQQAEHLRSLSPYEQVAEVFALEEKGIYFAKNLSKSIIYSVAPPGASQHLSLLAFDVAEFDDARVRSLLAENYWYQTVTSDLPHFTFLGAPERELRGLGLKMVRNCDRDFWVPDI